MALGYVACSWSTLQDCLGHLFSATMHAGALTDVALAAWHCHQNDRAQREMLLATAEAALQTRPDVLAAIRSLKIRVDRLADRRNDFVHASYALLSRCEGGTVIPDDYYGNRRSKSLAKKFAEGTLITELGNFRKRLTQETACCEELFQCLVDPEHAPSLGKS